MQAPRFGTLSEVVRGRSRPLWVGFASQLAFLLVVTSVAFGNDGLSRTLSNYDLQQGFGELHGRSDRVLNAAARFALHGSSRLDSIRLRFKGERGDTAVVLICGHDGGGPAPLTRSVARAATTIRKQRDGNEHIVVRFEPAVELSGDQFFVCVESFSGKLALLSDRVARPALCTCEDGEAFTYQCVRGESGLWESLPYAFLVDAYVRVDEDESASSWFKFTLDTLAGPSSGIVSAQLHYLATCDLNADGVAEIVFPGGVLTSTDRLRQWSLDTTLSADALQVMALVPRRQQDGTYVLVGLLEEHDVAGDYRGWRTQAGFEVQLVGCDEGGSPVSILLADINEDEFEDMILVYRSGLVEILRFDGDRSNSGKDRSTLLKPGTGFVHHALCVDADGDGDVDVVAAATDAFGSPRLIHAFNSAIHNNGFIHSGDSVLFEVVPEQIGNNIVCQPPVISADRLSAIKSGIEAVPTPRLFASLVYSPGVAVPGAGTSGSTNEMDILATIPYEDRVNAGSWPDLNLDGMSEFVTTAGDRCRTTKLYQRDRASGNLTRVFGSGVEAAAGAVDICWSDVDRDGDLDGVFLSRDHVLLLRNESKRSLPEAKIMNLYEHVRAVAVGGLMQATPVSSGRGWHVFERMDEGFAIPPGTDSIAVFAADGSQQRISLQDIIERGGRTLSAQQIKRVQDCTPKLSSNPFVNRVTISQPDGATMKRAAVYTATGNLVWSLEHPAQNFEWPGTGSDGQPVAVGSYVLFVETENCTGAIRLMKME